MAKLTINPYFQWLKVAKMAVYDEPLVARTSSKMSKNGKINHKTIFPVVKSGKKWQCTMNPHWQQL